MQQNYHNNQTGSGGDKPVYTPPVDERNHAVPPSETRKPAQQMPVNTDNTNQPPSATTPETRRTTGTHYYGRPIGQPVKVERQMRNRSETGSPEESKNKSSNTNTRSNSGRT